MCELTAEIKKSMSSIKKKKKNNDKIMLLTNAFEFFNSKTLIDIIHEEFVSINNVFRQCDEMKEEMENGI